MIDRTQIEDTLNMILTQMDGGFLVIFQVLTTLNLFLIL